MVKRVATATRVVKACILDGLMVVVVVLREMEVVSGLDRGGLLRLAREGLLGVV